MESRFHDDIIEWKHFPHYWSFVQKIHRLPVNSPHKGQWRGALLGFFICVWINCWENNREAGDLRRYRAHYDVIVMSMQHGPISDDTTYCTGLKEHRDGLGLDCSNSIGNALELLQSCTKPTIYARFQINSQYISHAIMMTSSQGHTFCLNGLVWVRIFQYLTKYPWCGALVVLLKKISVTKFCLKFTQLNSQPHLPVDIEIMLDVWKNRPRDTVLRVQHTWQTTLPYLR